MIAGCEFFSEREAVSLLLVEGAECIFIGRIVLSGKSNVFADDFGRTVNMLGGHWTRTGS